jgi:pSer/pThr/pTyr-binding forkhead associated (FHA) protein
VGRSNVLSGVQVAGQVVAGPASPDARILHRSRGRTVTAFDLRQPALVIGRGREAAVLVQAAGISREHARLTWDGAGYRIEDLGSRNGTFVNGQAVGPGAKERLRHLDLVTLGRRVELLFLCPAPPVRLVKRPRVVRATLVPVEGPAEPYEIPAGESVFGRAGGCDVVLEPSSVSKMHAWLQRTPEHVVVQDLGSSNGTFLNGVRVATALLGDGDRLTLGGAVTYRLEVETVEAWSVLDGQPGPPPGSAAGRDTLAEWDTEDDEDEGPVLDARETAEIAWTPPRPIAEVRLVGREIDLSLTEPGTYDVGRSPDAALRVNHPTVSRLQVRLTLAADRMSAQVAGVGTSVTHLNGDVLEGSAQLKDGDRLELGEVVFAVRLDRPDGA